MIRFGAKDEAYKFASGNKYMYKTRDIDTFPKKITLHAAKNDTAAFQIAVCADEYYSLSVTDTPYFSQMGDILNIRLSGSSPVFSQEINIIDMHLDDDGLYKADALLRDETTEQKREEIRMVWVEYTIPSDAEAGVYNASVSLYLKKMFEDETLVGSIDVEIDVADYTLPSPSEYVYHLDLWQHNSNLARKHEVTLWSDEHFAIMENYIKTLSELGQKAVTLVVSEIPWSGQNCYLEERDKANLYEYSIVGIKRDKNGSFVYDFSKMQRYIDLCAKYNINKEISLYGLANVWTDEEVGYGIFGNVAPDYPDNIRLRYFDEADGRYKYIRKAAEIDNYIKALRDYFVERGLIDIVRLAADEPADVEKYRKSIYHITSIAPEFKLKAAINHAEFVGEFGNEVYDFVPYLNALASEYDKMMEYKRTMSGKRFYWYVCCAPEFPNTYLKSNLLESYFIGVLSSYADMDGFLRWNYTVWNDDPRRDVGFGLWCAGDTNFVYPAKDGTPLLTLRYKALKRGIVLYELLEKLKRTGRKDALEQAYGFVVKEKDIRTYFTTTNSIDAMCSLEYSDYAKLKDFLIAELIK